MKKFLATLFCFFILYGLLIITTAAASDSSVIDIVNPAADSQINGTVMIQASLAQNNPVVQISIDGGSYEDMPFDGNYWQFSWETTGYANGSHIITVKARDSSGYDSSQTINVIINNNPS